MTEAPLLSEEARISPMIEEKRSTRDTTASGRETKGSRAGEGYRWPVEEGRGGGGGGGERSKPEIVKK